MFGTPRFLTLQPYCNLTLTTSNCAQRGISPRSWRCCEAREKGFVRVFARIARVFGGSILTSSRSWIAIQATAMEASKAKQDEAPESGELLFFGSSSWETVGKKSGAGDAGATYLSTPCRLAPLVGVPIVFVAGGSGKGHMLCKNVIT